MSPASPAINLDLYTDRTEMQALLQAQLPGFAEGRLQIEALAVHSARRNTSQRRNPQQMTLSYELQVSEPATGRRGKQRLYGEVFRNGGAANAQALAALQPLAPPAFGEALIHLPALSLLLWALPNDPGLPQLATLLDPLQMAPVLTGGAAAGLQVELLRHEPRQRATLRYTLTGASGAEPHTIYAKTFNDGRATALEERFKHFWQQAQNDASAPLVAQPLGCDARLRTLWQAPAVGQPLRPLLAGPDGPLLLARVADALARLHAAPLAPTADAVPRSVGHWLAEVRRRCQKISRAHPELRERVEQVAQAISAQAGRLADRPLSLIHGDFHPDQLWAHQGRVLLFDFDEFTLGDPMEDLAEFVLKLEQDGLAPARVQAFIGHYAAAAPARFDATRLAWHGAIQSLLQTSRAFIYQQPGWHETLLQRLAACEARTTALRTKEQAP